LDLHPSQLVKARLEVGTKLLTRSIAILEEPQRLAHNLAGRLVLPARDLCGNEALKRRCQRDVHSAPILARVLLILQFFGNRSLPRAAPHVHDAHNIGFVINGKEDAVHVRPPPVAQDADGVV
jgi:hypothetical protein